MINRRYRKDSKIKELLESRYNIPPKIIYSLNIIKEPKLTFSQLENKLIHGVSGTGKTLYSVWCGYCTLRDLRIPIMDNTLMFLSISEFLTSIKQYYKKSKNDDNYGIETINGETTTFEERLMDRCKTAKLLILDDLGTGKSTDWTNEILYSIINARYNSNTKLQKTIITTNFDPEFLSEKVDDRIVSRVFDMCDPVLFENQYRKS